MPYRNVVRFALSADSPTMEYNLTESRNSPSDKDGNDATRVRLIVEGGKSDSTPGEGAFTLSISDDRVKKTDGSSADPP